MTIVMLTPLMTFAKLTMVTESVISIGISIAIIVVRVVIITIPGIILST